MYVDTWGNRKQGEDIPEDFVQCLNDKNEEQSEPDYEEPKLISKHKESEFDNPQD